MKTFSFILAFALVFALFSTLALAQQGQEETNRCGGYADEFLQSEPCADIDLSESNCSQEQVSGCLSQQNMTAYNQYACCKYDVLAEPQEQSRKLKQGSSCFQLYTTQTIQYETENIVSILRYCKSIGYNTNYSAIFGDPSVLDAIDEAPTNEASQDQAPSGGSSPSAASYLGYSSLAVGLLLGFLLFV